MRTGAAYVKIPTQTVSTLVGPVTTATAGWKQIQAAWTKINGRWRPILNSNPVLLYNWPGRRISANISIVADTNDYVLYDNLPGLYFEGLMDVSVWVYPNVTIRGESTSSAFTISGFATGDKVNLYNYGRIQGRGGDGGAGGYDYGRTVTQPTKGQPIGINNNKTTFVTVYAAPTSGTPGGVGLVIEYPTTVINAGNIAGGGGGGGGGGGVNGGQGGGGAGFGSGANNGTLTSGGAGAVYGGAGGSRGTPGTNGANGGALGGAAGAAIQGVQYLGVSSNIGSTDTGSIIGPLRG